MNSLQRRSSVGLAWFCGAAIVLPALEVLQSAPADSPGPPKRFQPSADEFGALSRSVIALLHGRNTEKFAQELTASPEDWKAIAAPTLADADETLKSFTGAVESQLREAEASAQQFLARAELLHLDFTKGDLHLRAVDPPRFGRFGFGNTRYTRLQAPGDTIPSLQRLEFVLDLDGSRDGPPKGAYKLILHRLNKFPKGWRVAGGIQWESFPPGVADEKTAREMAIADKAANPGNTGLTDKEDPALLELGGILVRFLRQRDANLYAKEALVTSDLVWAQIQKSGETTVSRKELDQEVNFVTRQQVEVAQSMLAQAAETGIDLKTAEINIAQVSIGHLQRVGASGSLDGLMGEQLTLKLNIKADGKSKTGVPLSGVYVVGIDQVSRYGDAWKVQKGIRWCEVPTGVLDEKAAAALQFENYVAENRTLPPASIAPEIEFTSLDTDKRMRLSDLRGKVVVLDFWATWCGPCQKPMADLQQLRQGHPDWADKVALVALSIDDSLDIVRRHVNTRGWTNTFNVWAGDGGWQSGAAQSFRVSGVPTTYIIDPSGKILLAGHPASMALEDKVSAALKGDR